MRQVHRMVLRMLPGPFLGWLGVLMFLLVMQFLIMYLKDLVGKGLPFGVIVELVAYNLAYMFVLAVPMATLIAVLSAFGRLAENGAYAVMKSTGVSFQQIVWPVIVAAMLVSGAMAHFNSVVLPEANFRARALWLDIRSTRPGFELEPGVFYDGLENYMVLARDIPPESPSELVDVLIYDYSAGARYRTDIKARRGTIRSIAGGRYLLIDLVDGEIHRRRPQSEAGEDRYERTRFARHRLQVDVEDFAFQRSDPTSGRRTDRTMPSAELRRIADSLDATVVRERLALASLTGALGLRDYALQPRPGSDSRRLPDMSTAPPLPPRGDPAVSGAGTGGPGSVREYGTPGQARGADGVRRALESDTDERAREAALQEARAARARVENARRTLETASYQASRFRVEYYKKYSLAVSCLVFMLIAAPLGLSIRRGSIGMTAVLALGVLLFYWVALVIGEKQADRGHLAPWMGMWLPNMVGGGIALWLTVRESLDRRANPWRFVRRLRTDPAEA